MALPRTTQWEMPAPGSAARRHRILASWPEGEAPAGGWPVLYLLDGNVTFPIATASARMQDRVSARTGVAPAVLIGLGHAGDALHDTAGRSRDYTPPGPAQPSGFGGADLFLDFLEGELMPEIARRWPVDPARRAIFGHSLGGLFVLHAFLTRPGLFRRSVAASPSIWWANRAVLNAEPRFAMRPRVELERLGLMMIVGGDEQPKDATGLTAERRARLQAARMVDNARELAGRLAPLGPEVAVVELPGENHGSILPASISRGLRFALRPEPSP